MDGFLATEEIRKWEKKKQRQKTPVIALTADVQKGIEEQCQQSGMNAYFNKPFKKSQLIEILQHWLSSSSSQSAQISLQAQQQESASTKQAILDPVVLQQLLELRNTTGRDVLGKAISYFIEQTSKNSIELQQALDSNDADKLYFIAHSIKSASANLGAIKLPEYCAELEIIVKDNKLAEVSVLIVKINTALEEFLTALKDYLITHEPKLL
jgi:CheY-like chemotaxis protein